ncbi:hypothetical protein AJ78_01005 [Emergomyces pasteurianus Ep9510]|uniref:Uncharacterized protein n=1 Tax=Emergomyces pasteurianus Ep9510 TaxID=1447872 RepID=A0A1J9PRD4_9EURO|nr:hypothetical protein AJ78_01005 [Emergomyces pasteurianus Ep9510]
MSQAEQPDGSSKAKYFGKTSPTDLRDLQRNAASATPDPLAKAASYLEQAFSGMKTAWIGGWALNLRGSRRETHDLDFLVLVSSVVEVSCFGQIQLGDISISQTSWRDPGEDVRSTHLTLRMRNLYESITPSFQTPQGDRVNVIHTTWQVETKLTTWFGRRKESDFQDLEFLLLNYGSEIVKWSQFLDKSMGETFYSIYDVVTEDKERCKDVKKTLSL